MSAREELRSIYQKRASERFPVYLPFADRTLQVRALTAGERRRLHGKDTATMGAMVVLLCLEDPETNELVFNPNDLPCHQEEDLFAPEDEDAIVQAVLTASGMGEEAKAEAGKDSQETESASSFSFSPPVTASLPTNSETPSAAPI